MDSTPGFLSRENLQSVATWAGASVLSAFFSSIERFSCINLSTVDDSDEEADDRPMIAAPDASKDPTAAPGADELPPV